MKAMYNWSEDGIAEPVDVKRIVLNEDVICYHCDMPIPMGTNALKLTASDGDIYLLHRKCGKNALWNIFKEGLDGFTSDIFEDGR